MPNVLITKIEVKHAIVEVPNKCPECDADLTAERALTEFRVCSSVTYAHLDPAEPGECQSTTDTADEDVDWFGTEAMQCSACMHVIAGEIPGSRKHCVKCDAIITMPHLVPDEEERCDNCKDPG